MFNKRKSLLRQGRGQSTVEYIVLVTAVLGTVILFLNSDSSPFRKQLNATMTTTTNKIGTIVQTLDAATDPGAATPSQNNSGIITNVGVDCAEQGIDPTTGKCKGQ